jgi:uncharacterized membrane protein YdjX (TVP38/TMEM64 family)
MRRTTLIRLATLAVLAALIVATFWLVPVQGYLAIVLEWMQTIGPIGMILLGALYTPAALLFLPAWPLTLAGGFAFGVLRGTIIASMGSVLAASAAFLAGRTLARGFIEERLSRFPRFAAIDDAVAEHGFKIVLLTRLSPVLPFNLLNYAFGLTKVSFRDYVLASWIGMLPGTIMYTYLGSAANSLATLSTGDVTPPLTKKVMFVLGLVATLLVAIFVARVAKRALDRSIIESRAAPDMDAPTESTP